MTRKPSTAEVGEYETAFVKGDQKGEFNCGNCVHMYSSGPHDGACHHPVMVSYSKQPRDDKRFPIVDEDDCCRYVRRPED